MPFIVACPACGQNMRVADELAGREAQCPSCREIFRPQAPGEEIVPASARPAAPRPWGEEIRPGAPAEDEPARGYAEGRRPELGELPSYADYARRSLGDVLPGGGATTVVCVLFGVMALLRVGLMLLYISALPLFERLDLKVVADINELRALESRTMLLSTLVLVTFIAVVIVYLVWIHRMYSNLLLFGVHGLRFSPGWAVGAWFVPILNLIRPVQVVQEIWRASTPAVRADEPSAWQDEGLSPRVGFWWAVYLFAGIFVYVVSANQGVAADRGDTAGMRRGLTFVMVGEALVVVAILLAVWVVLGIYGRQKQKLRRLTTAPADEGTP